jgi:hypothetical protein
MARLKTKEDVMVVLADKKRAMRALTQVQALTLHKEAIIQAQLREPITTTDLPPAMAE